VCLDYIVAGRLDARGHRRVNSRWARGPTRVAGVAHTLVACAVTCSVDVADANAERHFPRTVDIRRARIGARPDECTGREFLLGFEILWDAIDSTHLIFGIQLEVGRKETVAAAAGIRRYADCVHAKVPIHAASACDSADLCPGNLLCCFKRRLDSSSFANARFSCSSRLLRFAKSRAKSDSWM